VPKLDTGQRVWNVPGLSTIRGLGGRLAGRQRLWLAGAEVDCRDHLDVIVDSISNMGEMASLNTNAALSEGDPAPLVQIAGPFGFYACCAGCWAPWLAPSDYSVPARTTNSSTPSDGMPRLYVLQNRVKATIWLGVMRGFRQESQPLSAGSQRRLLTLASLTVRRIVAANETSANRLVSGVPSAREMQCVTIVVTIKSTASMGH
jgi:hypothetical protein